MFAVELFRKGLGLFRVGVGNVGVVGLEWRDLVVGVSSFDDFCQLPDLVILGGDGFDLGLPNSDFFRLDFGSDLGGEGIDFPLCVGVES